MANLGFKMDGRNFVHWAKMMIYKHLEVLFQTSLLQVPEPLTTLKQSYHSNGNTSKTMHAGAFTEIPHPLWQVAHYFFH